MTNPRVAVLEEVAAAARQLLEVVQDKGEPWAGPHNEKLRSMGDTIVVNEGSLWLLQMALMRLAHEPKARLSLPQIAQFFGVPVETISTRTTFHDLQDRERAITDTLTDSLPLTAITSEAGARAVAEQIMRQSEPRYSVICPKCNADAVTQLGCNGSDPDCPIVVSIRRLAEKSQAHGYECPDCGAISYGKTVCPRTGQLHPEKSGERQP